MYRAKTLKITIFFLKLTFWKQEHLIIPIKKDFLRRQSVEEVISRT